MSVLVLAPTRDRRERADKMIRSFIETSTDAHMVVMVDDDQVDIYNPPANPRINHPRIEMVLGPRRSYVEMVNAEMLKRINDHDVFGIMVDDAVYATPGWDRWLMESNRTEPTVFAPVHNYGLHVDMPYVNREWIKRLGWFANPVFKYWCWVTYNSLLGEMTGLVQAPPDRFYVQHDDLGPRYWEYFDAEAKCFYEQCLWQIYPHAAMLKPDRLRRPE